MSYAQKANDSLRQAINTGEKSIPAMTLPLIFALQLGAAVVYALLAIATAIESK